MPRRPALALAIGLCIIPRALRAEEASRPLADYALGGEASAGYRLVDVDGSRDKYREDYNYRSGVRLFTLNLDGSSKAPETTAVDRFRLERGIWSALKGWGRMKRVS